MIEIRLPAEKSCDAVAFAQSPLVECVLSLHVLAQPSSHALRHGWVRRMRTLSGRLRSRVDAFAFAYSTNIPSLIMHRAHGGFDAIFESELARIADYSPEVLLDTFGGCQLQQDDDDGSLERLVRCSSDKKSARQNAELLLGDPAEFVRRFIGLLETYWDTTFRAEWERVEPYLRRSIAEDQELVATAGIWPLLARLPQRCHVDPLGNRLTISTDADPGPVAVTPSDPLVLMPSTFVWPNIFVNFDSPWPTWLAYGARSIVRNVVPAVPPSDLVDILQALGDESRLRVLKLIAAGPRTTQELAPLVGLSMSGASKTLSQLADSGLITKHREGRYVVYRLARGRLSQLARALDVFLGIQVSQPS